MEVRNRYFIWKRHARPRAADSITFWLDFVYGMGVDGLEFAAHPTSMTPLQHARGVLGGWVSCLADPPRYDEPPARREYDVDFAPADCRVPAPLGAAAGGGTGLDARLHTGSAQ